MTPAQISRAQDQIRALHELRSWLPPGRPIHRATITLHAPRSGPGNDRDSIEVEVDTNIAFEALCKRADSIEAELRGLGVTLDGDTATARE